MAPKTPRTKSKASAKKKAARKSLDGNSTVTSVSKTEPVNEAPQQPPTRPQDEFKRDLTEREIQMVVTMAGFNMPYVRIAAILGMDEDTFRRLRKQHDTLQQRMDRQRANNSGVAHQTLFEMMTNKNHKKQFEALKFWCQTQEGFKTADRVEITGADGGPVEHVVMTSEQRRAAIKELDRRLEICDDE